VVPTVLGFDPRIQLCHEDDALAVLQRAALEDHAGTYNVGGRGVLLLSQAVRRAGRVAAPVPSPTVPLVGQLLRRGGLVDFSPEQTRFLSYGRVVDTSRLEREFGFPLAWTTAAAFDDFVRGRDLHPLVEPEVVTAVEQRTLSLLDRVAGQPRPPIGAGAGR